MVEKILYEGKPKKNLWIHVLLFRGLVTSIAFGALGWMIASVIVLSIISAHRVGDFPIPVFLAVSVIFFVVTLILHIFYLHLLVETYKYKINNKKITFEGGILLKVKKVVPFHKITDVGISQDIIERRLGFSNLNIHTAGTGAAIPEIKFYGLEDSEKPHKIISKIIEKFSSDRYGE